MQYWSGVLARQPAASTQVGRSWAALVLAATLAGCGNGEQRVESSQVAAVVNRNEITVHQVDLVLSKVDKQPGEPAAAVGQRALGALIDQELAAQAARNEGLDREPAVIQAQQAAAREVLARAFLERVAAKAVGPDSIAIDSYYESRPELFARRRIYTLQEFVATGEAAVRERIPALSRESRNAEDLEARLNAAGLKVMSNRFVRAAEDMPGALLKQFSAGAPGHAVVVPAGDVTRIFFILEAAPAPVDRRAASPSIARVLMADAQRKLLEQRIEELRKGAEIDYRGAFADARQAAETTNRVPGL